MDKCPYRIQGCTFVTDVPGASLMHVKIAHHEIVVPESGSEGELRWLQFGITEEGIRAARLQPQMCEICDEESLARGDAFGVRLKTCRYDNYTALARHLRQEHAAVLGLDKGSAGRHRFEG